MDFPKDHQWKRRANLNQPNLFHKPITKTEIPNTHLPLGKRKIQIEQYQYEQQNLLGVGYSSKVYLGHLIEDARKQFAIKVIDRRRLSKEKQNVQLLKQEMVIHQQLDHPNIVKCHEIIEKVYHYYIVLEYCPQGTLDSFIKKHQKLSQSTVVTIVEQIISAYKYLLDRKILHRDLKPPNILKAGNIWKVGDFGFSVMGKKNLIGEINVGTPAYMAPQSLERTYYSPKTDFFSIGVMCYEMLFGVTPWQHKSEKVLLALMQEKKMNHETLSSISNKNLANFMIKCCEPIQRKRLSLQEFQEFNFWKDYQPPKLTSIKTIQSQTAIAMQAKSSSKTFCTIRDHSAPTTKCPSQATTFSTTKGVKKESIQQIFKTNASIIERQLYMCQIVLSLMKNYSLLGLTDDCESDMYLSVLSKHVNYIIRRIKHPKFNYLGLRRWEEYCQNEVYAKFIQQATLLSKNVEEILRMEAKRKSIITIRTINKRYDQLTYDKNISNKCITNLKEYLFDIMVNFIKRHQDKSEKELQKHPSIPLTLSYLNKYYIYMKNIHAGSELSRTLSGISEDCKERGSIVYDFLEAKETAEQFFILKNQILAQQP